MKIPFVDLRAQYLAHRAELDAAIQSVIDTSNWARLRGSGGIRMSKPRTRSGDLRTSGSSR